MADTWCQYQTALRRALTYPRSVVPQYPRLQQPLLLRQALSQDVLPADLARHIDVLLHTVATKQAMKTTRVGMKL